MHIYETGVAEALRRCSDPLDVYASVLQAAQFGVQGGRTIEEEAVREAGLVADDLGRLFNHTLDVVGNAGFWAGVVSVAAFALCPATGGATCVVAVAAANFSTAAGIVGTLRVCVGSFDRNCAISAVSTAVGARTGNASAARSFGSAFQSAVSVAIGNVPSVTKYGWCDPRHRDAEGFCRP